MRVRDKAHISCSTPKEGKERDNVQFATHCQTQTPNFLTEASGSSRTWLNPHGYDSVHNAASNLNFPDFTSLDARPVSDIDGLGEPSSWLYVDGQPSLQVSGNTGVSPTTPMNNYDIPVNLNQWEPEMDSATGIDFGFMSDSNLWQSMMDSTGDMDLDGILREIDVRFYT